MSHITLAQNGLNAAAAKQWDVAFTKLSKALESSTNPTWLLARSKALINLSRYEEALADAELAWHTAYERNKRELITEANYRRAVAHFRLGQFANADCCCIYSMRLVKGFPAVEKEDPAAQWTNEKGQWTATLEDAKTEAQTDEINSQENSPLPAGGETPKANPGAKMWRMASTLRMQILWGLQKLAEDDPARKITITAKPPKNALAKAPEVKEEKKPEAPAAALPKPVIPEGTPLRLQEFQSNTSMNVSIFSKGVNKEALKADFQSRSVTLDSLIYPGGETKPFELALWGEIDTDASKVSVTPNKVELTLVKKTPGKWAQLSPSEDGAVAATLSVQPAKPKDAPTVPEVPKTAPDTKPAEKTANAYPSSSKTGAKNWDKIGEEGSDDESDVNLFFKKLYRNATPEQQRAMMKSFTESNGTSLSTDWNDVKARTVETVPPEGVEAKKWEK